MQSVTEKISHKNNNNNVVFDSVALALLWLKVLVAGAQTSDPTEPYYNGGYFGEAHNLQQE